MDILKTGISGLDDLLGGGIPAGHITAVLGPPGTGKSTFALQFTFEGLKNGENCVYLSLEESEEDIIMTAKSFGWDIKPYIDTKKLALVRLSSQNIKATIDRVENDLPRLFKSFKAKRLSIDPITLYEMIHDSESKRRDHLFNFAQMIKETGMTSIFTSEISMDNPYYSKFGLIEYVADGVIVLRHVRTAELRTATTFVEVLKMRRIEHSKDIKPYNITRNGLVVHKESMVFI
jgi:circadian clock protein KaiC